MTSQKHEFVGLDVGNDTRLGPVTDKPAVEKKEQKLKTSILARTSLVVGILSVATLGFLSPAGVVFGLVSLVQVNCSGGQLKGNLSALLGILLSLAPVAHTFFLRLIFPIV